MKPRNLLFAAVLLAALSGAVWWSKRHPEAAQSTDTSAAASVKLVDIPDAQIQEVTLQKKDGAVSVQRKGNKWAITQPQSFPTDQDAVSSLASAFNPVTADNVVEDKTADYGKYGLAAPGLIVTVQAKSGKKSKIEFGDDVPAGSLVYARFDNGPKVYAVSSSVKTSFDKSANDLRDKRLLAFDTTSLTRIQITSGKSDLEFGKSNSNEWQILKPQPYRADNFQVEELLRKLSDAKMDLSSAADTAAKTQTQYTAGQPVATAKVTDASGAQAIEVRKNKEDYYARSASAGGTYKVTADLGKELEKTIDDFRNKKVFDFGFSDPTKIEITGTPGEKTLVRSGTDWKMGNQVMDPGTVQSFIDKVRDLAAAKFVSTGFSSPEFGVSVTSNDGKRVEHVEFAKVQDAYIARRGSEPALYQMDTKPATDVIEAIKSIKPAQIASKK